MRRKTKTRGKGKAKVQQAPRDPLESILGVLERIAQALEKIQADGIDQGEPVKWLTDKDLPKPGSMVPYDE